MKVFKLSITFLALAVIANGFWNSNEMDNQALATLETQSIKRMDELNGTFTRGKRNIFIEEVKVEKKKTIAKVESPKKVEKEIIREVEIKEPVIREDADLQLVEYYNPKGAGKVLYADEVEGQLIVRSGEIQDLNFSLDEDSFVRLDSEEFKGNTFTYFADGESHRGQIYPISRTSYMLTLSSGPHAGVRMKFQDPSTSFKKPASVEKEEFEEEQFEDETEESIEYAQNQTEVAGFKF